MPHIREEKHSQNGKDVLLIFFRSTINLIAESITPTYGSGINMDE